MRSGTATSPRPDLAAPQPVRHSQWRDFLRHWSVVVALTTAALSTVADLGDHVFNHAPGTFDAGVRAWALAHRTPGGMAFFTFVATVGAPIVVLLVAAGVAVWFWRAQGRHVAALVLGAPVIAIVLFNVVKHVVHRTRPAGAVLLLRDLTFSFPSGHATAAAAVFGTLGWVLAREGKVSWFVAAPLAVLIPLLIGASRVYLDVHWATDVLAGWCAGAAVAAVTAGVYEHGRRRRARVA